MLFSLLVLTLNFLALAGVCFGLLLLIPAVREAIHRTRIRSDVLSAGLVPRDQLKPLTDAILSKLLLGTNSRLSKRKIAVVSFLSGLLFLLSITGSFPVATPDSPASKFFGGGVIGVAASTLALCFVIWPAHFIYDFVVSSVLLRAWRRVESRSLIRKVWSISITISLLSILPILLALTVTVSRHGVGFVNPSVLGLKDYLVIAPLIFNGPVLLWLLVFFAIFSPTGASGLLGPAQIAILVLSCALSGAVLTGIAIARTLGTSRRIARLVAAYSATIADLDAKRLFNYSIFALTVGNALLQIFGISVASISK